MLKNSSENYGLIAKTLHWVIAILIIGLIWLGWYMVDLTYFDRWYNTSLSTHRSLGLLVFALAVLMLAWRVYSRPPPLVSSIPGWEKVIARSTHVLLYIMMLAIPLSGYLISTSAGKHVSLFGWFEIPPIMQVDETLRDRAIAVHYYLAYGSCFLLGLHVLGALKHEFISRDRTLRKML